MPRLVDEHRDLVATLEETLSNEKSVDRACAEMRRIVGHFQVTLGK